MSNIDEIRIYLRDNTQATLAAIKDGDETSIVIKGSTKELIIMLSHMFEGVCEKTEIPEKAMLGAFKFVNNLSEKKADIDFTDKEGVAHGYH